MESVSKYIYTDDMDEISGFGGGYEATCRAMVVAGLEWWDANPDATPKFLGCKNIYGVISEDNDDAKALSKAVVEGSSDDCTGAMHQATITHIFRIRKVGWNQYCDEMKAKKVSEG